MAGNMGHLAAMMNTAAARQTAASASVRSPGRALRAEPSAKKARHDPNELRGLVDVQVNGYQGITFTPVDHEVSIDSMRKACRNYLHDAKVVAFVPTVITAPLSVYQRVLPLFAELIEEPEFVGRLPGIHLEGPFISAEAGAVGAHNVGYVAPPSIATFDELQRLARGNVRIITIAAEVAGAAELCAHCVASGVTVSMGHQLAGAEDIARLAARHLT